MTTPPHTPEHKSQEEQAGKDTSEVVSEAADAVSEAVDAVSDATADASDTSQPGRSWRERLRRPTVREAAAFVALVGAIVALLFKLAPGCQPQPPPGETGATISEVVPRRPVTFGRFLQRQQIPPPTGMPERFLARRGVMVEFHFKIVGLAGKHLQLSWELSDAVTNDLVAAEQSAYKLTPSKNVDEGDWGVWILAPKPGHSYYATVTIHKPEGPPYVLKHFDTPSFPGCDVWASPP